MLCLRLRLFNANHTSPTQRDVWFCLTPSSSLVSQSGAIFFFGVWISIFAYSLDSAVINQRGPRRPFNASCMVATFFPTPLLPPASTCPTLTTHVRPLNATCVVLPSLAQSCWLQSIIPLWFQLEFPTSASDFTPLTVPNLWVWNSAPSSSRWIIKMIYCCLVNLWMLGKIHSWCQNFVWPL